MGYAESLLASGERITMRDRQHWLAPLRRARVAVVLLLLALLAFVLGAELGGTLRTVLSDGALVLFVAGALWLGLVLLRWRSEAYLVTNRRVVKVTGVISKHVADAALEQINDAILDQSLLGRLLGYGDLGILTSTKADVDPQALPGEIDRFTMLAHVKKFKITMLDQKQELEFESMRPPQ